MVACKKVIDVVLDIQKKNPQLSLCGSAALIFANLLKEREVGDIDFILHKKDMDNLVGLNYLRKDRYTDHDVEDGYDSYHGYYSFGFLSTFYINLLVFKDDIPLETETINYLGNTIMVQKVDDILCWKKKYNRSKDIKDLENIATKAVEDILIS